MAPAAQDAALAAWAAAAAALEAHGWKLLAALALGYALRARYQRWAAERRVRRSLADANDPARVAALSRDAARVREQQQRALAASTKSRRRAT